MGKSQQAQGPDGFGFIVHNYVCTSTSSALPSAGVIDAGRVFIKQASISTGWSPSKLAPDTSVFKATCNVLSFSQVPPVVAGQMTRQRIHELKEWGTSANGDDDSFSLNDLEEFKSTDFQWAPPGAMDPRIGSDAVSVPILTLARKYSSTKMTEGPKPKRRRLDISPLHSIIPKPHFHLPPSPSPPVRPKVPTPPYTKSIPTPYGRHTVSSIQEFLLSDSRGAWIIPVRGILPWQESTTASILKPITELSLAYSTQALSNNTPQGSNIDLPNGVSESGEIIWTQTSLVSFWNFLLTLRQANTLGPLSLSFHAAPSHPHSHAYSLSSPEYSLSSKGDDTGRNVLRSDSDDGAHLCRIPLLAVDHIKVYHDVEYAMLLRNVWDAWGFLPQVKGAEVVIDQNKWAGGDAKLKKIRILKGAKLVLVDERSKGVLLS